MQFDNLFWIAFQSSFILGLVHGVNPCGHSWLVLAPFVVGARKGRRVAVLSIAFLFGTVLACLLLGLTLGAVSRIIPPQFEHWVGYTTSGFLVLLGGVLLVKPSLLHHHDHDHHSDAQDHGAGLGCRGDGACGVSFVKRHRVTGTALFSIGFVNMIIPCPTVAIMYGYALDSASAVKATAVFGIYAVGTAIAVAVVIYAIHRVTTLLKALCQAWVEAAIMRTAGVITIGFAIYAIWQQVQA